MPAWTQRLAELGIELPPVAKPVAAYIPAQKIGSTVRTSGQLPSRNGELVAQGKVSEGEEGVSPDLARSCARVAALNALAAAAEAAGGLDQIESVAHVTGYVASTPDFTGQPQVVNGASELIGEIFGEAGAHTRSAVGVSVLPLDAPVEIELSVVVASSASQQGA